MAKKPTEPRIRLNRIDFFRLRGEEFFEALCKCIDKELGEPRNRGRLLAKLTPHQQGAYAWWNLYTEVHNGGLAQYFYNWSDASVPALLGLLKAAGNDALAGPLKQAVQFYRKHVKEFAVDNPFGEDGLFARMTELAKLDKVFARLLAKTCNGLEKWLRANISLIAIGNNGEPIDPKFSGEIVAYFPNGKTHEQASVRRGVLSGEYRRYFKDGELEHSCFYKGGAVSTDFWPNGQPKHKTIKRGKLTIDEWYHPSGNIRKRHVADKDGWTVEPVRMWHDNGQLAEEIHVVKGRKRGPWLKFFDDGSPRLQAEHRNEESLVIHNAWDSDRQQVVKNGNGTYVDDGWRIDDSYALYFESDWTTSREVRKGVPHGKGTTWHQGLVWSEEEFSDGKRHGNQTVFYDNGRVRTRCTWRNGKVVKSEEFPKFDHPRPAVLIRTEATAELYEAWKYPLLDSYPTPRNLEQVQGKLRTIPAFLQGVFERNQSKSAITDDDDDDDDDGINTFDDSIAYFADLNERGTVEKVQFSGCGAYSISAVDAYPPIICKLKFEPGVLRGRNVRCRVVVWIHHTFVEDADSAG